MNGRRERQYERPRISDGRGLATQQPTARIAFANRQHADTRRHANARVAAAARKTLAAALVGLAAALFAPSAAQSTPLHGAPVQIGPMILSGSPSAPLNRFDTVTFQWRAPDNFTGEITGYQITRQKRVGPLPNLDPNLCYSASGWTNDGSVRVNDISEHIHTSTGLEFRHCYRFVVAAYNAADQLGTALTTRVAFARSDTSTGCPDGQDRIWFGDNASNSESFIYQGGSPRGNVSHIRASADWRWGYGTFCAGKAHIEGGDWCNRLNYAHGDAGRDANARVTYVEGENNGLHVSGQTGAAFDLHCYIEGTNVGLWEPFHDVRVHAGYDICHSRLNRADRRGNRLGTNLASYDYRDIWVSRGARFERDLVCGLNDQVNVHGFPRYSSCQGYAEYSFQHRGCHCRGLSENLAVGADDKWNCACNIKNADPVAKNTFNCQCPIGSTYHPDKNACLPSTTVASNPAFFASEDLRRFDMAVSTPGAPVLVGAVEIDQTANTHVLRWRPPAQNARGGGRVLGYEVVNYVSKTSQNLGRDPGYCGNDPVHYNAEPVRRVGPEVFSMTIAAMNARCYFMEIRAVNGEGAGAVARTNGFFHRQPNDCQAGHARIWGGPETDFNDHNLIDEDRNRQQFINGGTGYGAACRPLNWLEDGEWCNRLNYSYGTAGHKINARYGFDASGPRFFCHIDGADTERWEPYDGSNGRGPNGRNFCADRGFGKVNVNDGCHLDPTCTIQTVDHDFQCNMRPTNTGLNSEGEFAGSLCGAYSEHSETHRRCECRGLAVGLKRESSGVWNCGCDVAGASHAGGACECPAGTEYHPDENACLAVSVNRLADSTALSATPADGLLPARPVTLRLEVTAEPYPGMGSFNVFFADAPRPLLGCENADLPPSGTRTRAGTCVARDGLPQGVSTLAATYRIPNPLYRGDAAPAVALVTILADRRRDCEDVNPLVNPVGGTLYRIASGGEYCALENHFAADNGLRICDWNPTEGATAGGSVHPFCPTVWDRMRAARCVEQGALFRSFTFNVPGQTPNYGCVCADGSPVPCGLNARLHEEILKANPVPATVAALISAGANVNGVDGNGDAFLFVAARLGHANIVRALLENGADPGWRQGDAELSFAHFMAHKNATAPGLTWAQAVVVLETFGAASDAAETTFGRDPFDWNARDQVGTLALDYLRTAYTGASGDAAQAGDIPFMDRMGNYMRDRGSECAAHPDHAICAGSNQVRCETADPRVNPAGGNWFEFRRCDMTFGETGAFQTNLGDFPPSCVPAALSPEAGDNECGDLFQRMRKAACLENPVLQFRSGGLEEGHTDLACVCRDGGAPPNCGATGQLLAEIRKPSPDLATITSHIQDGADTDGVDGDGVGFIYIAATLNHPEVLRILLNEGADPGRRFGTVENLTFPHFLADIHNRSTLVRWESAEHMLTIFGAYLSVSQKEFDWNARDNQWRRAMDYFQARHRNEAVTPDDTSRDASIIGMANHMRLQGSECSELATDREHVTCVGTEEWRCETPTEYVNPAGGDWIGVDGRCDLTAAGFRDTSAGAPACLSNPAAEQSECDALYAQMRTAECLPSRTLHFRAGGPNAADFDLECVCRDGGEVPCGDEGLFHAELLKTHPSTITLAALLDRGVDIDGETDDGVPYLFAAGASGHATVIRFMVERGADHLVTRDDPEAHGRQFFSHFMALKNITGPDITWTQAATALAAFGDAVESANKSFDWTATDSDDFQAVDHLRFRLGNDTITPEDETRDAGVQAMAHYMLFRGAMCSSHHDSTACRGTSVWRCATVNPAINPIGGMRGDNDFHCYLNRDEFYNPGGFPSCTTLDPVSNPNTYQCDALFGFLRTNACHLDPDLRFKSGGANIGNFDLSCVCADGSAPPCGKTSELFAEISKPNPSPVSVTALIGDGANVDGVVGGIGFLYVAASLGHAAIVQTLIQQGADPNRPHVDSNRVTLNVAHFLALKNETAPGITWAQAAGVLSAFGDAVAAAGKEFDWNSTISGFPMLLHLRSRHDNTAVSPGDNTRQSGITSMAHYAIFRGADCGGNAQYAEHSICIGTTQWRCETVNPMINPAGGNWDALANRCVFPHGTTSQFSLLCYTAGREDQNDCEEVYATMRQNACLENPEFNFLRGGAFKNQTDLSCACREGGGTPPNCGATGLLLAEISKADPSLVLVSAQIAAGANVDGPAGSRGFLYVAASLGHADVVRVLVENGADPERVYAPPGGTVTLNLAHYLAARDLYAPDSLTWREAASVLASFGDAVESAGAAFDWTARDGDQPGNQGAIDYLRPRYNDANVTPGDVTKAPGIEAMANYMLFRGAQCILTSAHVTCEGTSEWRCETANARVNPIGGEWDATARRCALTSSGFYNIPNPATGAACWTAPSTGQNDCETVYTTMRDNGCAADTELGRDLLFRTGTESSADTVLSCICHLTGELPDEVDGCVIDAALEEILQPSPSAASVAALIQAGISSADGPAGQTGLMFVAASLGLADVVRVLIENGANPTLRHTPAGSQVTLNLAHFVAANDVYAAEGVSWADSAAVLAAFGDAVAAAGKSFDWGQADRLNGASAIEYLRPRYDDAAISPQDSTKSSAIESMAHYMLERGAQCGSNLEHVTCAGTGQWRCETVNSAVNPVGGEWDSARDRCAFAGEHFYAIEAAATEAACYVNPPSTILNRCDDFYTRMRDNACHTSGALLYAVGGESFSMTNLSCVCRDDGETPHAVSACEDPLRAEIMSANPSTVSIAALIQDGGWDPDGPADALGFLFVAASLGHSDVVRALVENGADVNRGHTPPGSDVTLNLAHFLAANDLHSANNVTWADSAEVMAVFGAAAGESFDWNSPDRAGADGRTALDYLRPRYDNSSITPTDATRLSGIRTMAHYMLFRGAECREAAGHDVCRGTEEWRCETANPRVNPAGGDWDPTTRKCALATSGFRSAPAEPACWHIPAPGENECGPTFTAMRANACLADPDLIHAAGGGFASETDLSCVCRASGEAPHAVSGCANPVLTEIMSANPSALSVEALIRDEGQDANGPADAVGFLFVAASLGLSDVVRVLVEGGADVNRRHTPPGSAVSLNLAHFLAAHDLYAADGVNWAQSAEVLTVFGDAAAAAGAAFDWNAADSADGLAAIDYLNLRYDDAAVSPGDSTKASAIQSMAHYMLLRDAQCAQADSTHVVCAGTGEWRCETVNARVNPIGGDWDSGAGRCALAAANFYNATEAACWMAPTPGQNECENVYMTMRDNMCADDSSQLFRAGAEIAADTDLSCVCRETGEAPDETTACVIQLAPLLEEILKPAPSTAAIAALIDGGEDANGPADEIGYLFVAASLGHSDVVRVLVEKGANANRRHAPPGSDVTLNLAHFLAAHDLYAADGVNWARSAEVLAAFGDAAQASGQVYNWRRADSDGVAAIDYLRARYDNPAVSPDDATKLSGIESMADYLLSRGATCRQNLTHVTCAGSGEYRCETVNVGVNPIGGVWDSARERCAFAEEEFYSVDSATGAGCFANPPSPDLNDCDVVYSEIRRSACHASGDDLVYGRGGDSVAGTNWDCVCRVDGASPHPVSGCADPLLTEIMSANPSTMVIAELIRSGSDANGPADGTGFLFVAASLGLSDVVRVLVEGGADPNRRHTPPGSVVTLNLAHFLAAHNLYAADGVTWADSAEVLTVFGDAAAAGGAAFDWGAADSEGGLAAIDYLAARYDDNGVSPSDSTKRTAIEAMAVYMLSQGAQCRQRDSTHVTCAGSGEYRCENVNPAVNPIGGDWDADNGRCVFAGEQFHSVGSGGAACLANPTGGAIDCDDVYGQMRASACHADDNLLFATETDLTCVCRDSGESPHPASGCADPVLTEILSDSPSAASIEMLIQDGRDANGPADEIGFLFVAATLGLSDVVRVLVEGGADPNRLHTPPGTALTLNLAHFLAAHDLYAADGVNWATSAEVLTVFGGAVIAASETFDWGAVDSAGGMAAIDYLSLRYDDAAVSTGDATKLSAIEAMADYMLSRGARCSQEDSTHVTCMGSPAWRCENVNSEVNPIGGVWNSANSSCVFADEQFYSVEETGGAACFAVPVGDLNECEDVYRQMRASPQCHADNDLLYGRGDVTRAGTDLSCVCRNRGQVPDASLGCSVQIDPLLTEIMSPNPSTLAIMTLIQAGSDPNGPAGGTGFLFVAASLGHSDVVRVLLENGANPSRLHAPPASDLALNLAHFLAAHDLYAADDVDWADSAEILTIFGAAAGESFNWGATDREGGMAAIDYLASRYDDNNVSSGDNTKLPAIQAMADYMLSQGARCSQRDSTHVTCAGSPEWRCVNVNPEVNPIGGVWNSGDGSCAFAAEQFYSAESGALCFANPSVDTLNDCEVVYDEMRASGCHADDGLLYASGDATRAGTNLSCVCRDTGESPHAAFGCADPLLTEILSANPSTASIAALIQGGMDPNGPADRIGLLFVAAARGHSDVVQVLLENGANPNRLHTPSGSALTLNLAHFLAAHDLYAEDGVTWADSAEVLTVFGDAAGAAFTNSWGAADSEGGMAAIDYLASRYDNDVSPGDSTKISAIQSMADYMLSRGARCSQQDSTHVTCAGSDEWRCVNVNPDANPIGGEWDSTAGRCALTASGFYNLPNPATGAACWTTPSAGQNECELVYESMRRNMCADDPTLRFRAGAEDAAETDLTCVCLEDGEQQDILPDGSRGCDIQSNLLAQIMTAHPSTAAIVNLIQREADPNGPADETGYLFVAASLGHSEVVRILLENGADPNRLHTPSGSQVTLNLAHFLAAHDLYAEDGVSWANSAEVLFAFGDAAGAAFANWGAPDSEGGMAAIDYLASRYDDDTVSQGDATKLSAIQAMADYMLSRGARCGQPDSTHVTCMGSGEWRCVNVNSEVNPIGGEWDSTAGRCALPAANFYNATGAACWTTPSADQNECESVYMMMRDNMCADDPALRFRAGAENAADTELNCVCAATGNPPDESSGCLLNEGELEELIQNEFRGPSPSPDPVSVATYLAAGGDPNREIGEAGGMSVALLVTAAALGSSEVVSVLLTAASVVASVAGPDGGNVAHIVVQNRGDSWEEASEVLTVFGGAVEMRTLAFHWNAEDNDNRRAIEHLSAAYNRADAADRPVILRMANYMLVRGAGCRGAVVGAEDVAGDVCQGTFDDISELRKLCRDTWGGDLEGGVGFADMICSGIDATDTFCILGSPDAFPCRGLLRHVRRCNYDYNRPAENMFFCGPKCAAGYLAAGGKCCTEASVAVGECEEPTE